MGDLALNRPGATLRQKSSDIQSTFPFRVFLAKILGVHNSERAWRHGAIGEEEVARRLQKLSKDWRVIHSVPIGENGTDIDHLVIGPGGVFTLNTKNHLGKRVTVYDRVIYVSGMKLPYITKSRAEGRRTSALLSAACGFQVSAIPVIVIMASELIVKALPGDVAVVGRRQIVDWLIRRPTQLSTDQIDAIFSVARQRQAWQR
jgi:Nuclease-related domain